MQPRTDNLQRCLQFSLMTTSVIARDDVPGSRRQRRPSLQHPRPPLAPDAHGGSAGRVSADAPAAASPRAGGMASSRRAWPRRGSGGSTWRRARSSRRRRRSTLCDARSGSSAATIRSSPLRRLMGEMYARFEYSPRSTRVDSPIDEALDARKGVCQDFAHIFLSLVRPLGIPARYVSGYLFQASGESGPLGRRRHSRVGRSACCPTSDGSASTRRTT